MLDKDLKGEGPITREHVDNHTAVRKMLAERGVRPEALTPAEDVRKVRRRLESEQKKLARGGGTKAAKRSGKGG